MYPLDCLVAMKCQQNLAISVHWFKTTHVAPLGYESGKMPDLRELVSAPMDWDFQPVPPDIDFGKSTYKNPIFRDV